MTTNYRTALILVSVYLAAVWAYLLMFVPQSVYWRDGGEFLISAFYMDVAHPAGFPTYSTLANIFALVPLGPIAWRINAFSSALAVGVIGLSIPVTYLTVRPIVHCSRAIAFVLSFVPSLILLSSTSFLLGAFTAEAYLLNTLFVLVLLVLWLLYIQREDARLLLLMAFVMGIGLGNHVSLALIGLLMLPAVLLRWKQTARLLLPGLALSLIGLGVYGYLPVRAMSDPPLNTGRADSTERLSNLLTDARDRYGREPPQARKVQLATHSTTDEEKSSLGQLLPLQSRSLFALAARDYTKLIKDTYSTAVAIGIVGVMMLALYSGLQAYTLAAIALGNWLFFAGWAPDPWIPLVLVLGLGLAVSVASCFNFLAKRTEWIAKIVVASVVAALTLVVSKQLSPASLAPLHNYEAARVAAKRVLQQLPERALLFVEPSYFGVRYLQTIESYRDDVVTLHSPSFTLPEYFDQKEVAHVSNPTVSLTGPAFSPAKQSIDQSIGRLAHYDTLWLEPASVTNQYLSKVMQFRPNGILALQKDIAGSFDRAFLDACMIQIQVTQIGAEASGLVQRLADDAQAHGVLLITLCADALSAAEHNAAAAALLEAHCAPIERSRCGSVQHNTLTVYHLRAGNMRDAALWGLYGLLKGGDTQALSYNTNLAIRELPNSVALKPLTDNPKSTDIVKKIRKLADI